MSVKSIKSISFFKVIFSLFILSCSSFHSCKQNIKIPQYYVVDNISVHFWSIFYFLIPSIPQILIALPVPGTTRKILGSYKFLNYYSPFSTRVTETFHHPTLTSIQLALSYSSQVPSLKTTQRNLPSNYHLTYLTSTFYNLWQHSAPHHTQYMSLFSYWIKNIKEQKSTSVHHFNSSMQNIIRYTLSNITE